jgi:hypothetical protein
VAFTSQTTGICTVSGSTVTIVTAGTCVIAGNQAGDANWTAASQQTQSITISQASQAAFTATATPNTINVGGTSTISAAGGSGTGTNAYTLVSGSPCNLVAQTLTGTGSGICTVTATNPGDTNYLQSTSNVTVNVNLTPQTGFTLNLSSNSVTTGTPVNLGATGGQGNGQVTYTAVPQTLVQSASARTTAKVASVGLQCTVSGSILTPTGGTGVCVVTATKAADGTYAQATSTGNVTVTSRPPNPIPTLSEWAQILMMLMMVITAGWYGRRQLR